MARSRTAREILVLALAVFLFAGLSFLFLGQRKAGLESAALKEMTFYILRNGDPASLISVPLLAEGREEQVNPDDLTLFPADQYRLTGDFDRPTFWYVLWFDTNGYAAVNPGSRTAQVEVMYPANAMAQLNRKDPSGVHLLVLVEGSIPPQEGVELLENIMHGLGKPPDPPSRRLAIIARGVREERGLPAGTLAGDYVQAIRDRMPAGLKPALMLFVHTKK